MSRLEGLEKDVFAEMCKAEIEVCKSCSENEKKHGPLTFFNIGKGYKDDPYKILFVGKNTWYDESDVKRLEFVEHPPSHFKDCRDDGRDMFEHNCSMFWNCLREITQKLYDDKKQKYNQLRNSHKRCDYFDEQWEHIAVTNLTK